MEKWGRGLKLVGDLGPGVWGLRVFLGGLGNFGERLRRRKMSRYSVRVQIFSCPFSGKMAGAEASDRAADERAPGSAGLRRAWGSRKAIEALGLGRPLGGMQVPAPAWTPEIPPQKSAECVPRCVLLPLPASPRPLPRSGGFVWLLISLFLPGRRSMKSTGPS